MSETIDYGIAFGTTNSSIAKVIDNGAQIFKNNEGFEYTPSVVWMDPQGNLKVDRKAKEKLADDPYNAFGEFKLQMGTTNKYLFSRSDLWMTPEQLSAEVFKSLKTDVKLQNEEDISSVVISVPAAFELPQCKATYTAAMLAEFSSCQLLQDPLAAALAHGIQIKKDKVFWLVYDFGGGTFDAAVIQVKDGFLEVINNSGDNHLGGKLLDREIVNELLVPAITHEYKLQDFRSDNPVYWEIFSKLKYEAEQAKIRLSKEESVEINIDFLWGNKNREEIKYNYELKKNDFERIALPIIKRSINICRKVLVEKKLGPEDFEKVILVGGTSLIPSLRSMLKDSNEGLGIELDYSLNPFTAIAKGAAIYAGTQRKPMFKPKTIKESNEYLLKLEYEPAGIDLEPPIGGKVEAEKEKNYTGFTIEFFNKSINPSWRSGKYLLNKDGAFLVQLWAEKGKKSTYQIELLNPQGIKQKTIPETISYRYGPIIDSISLSHSVGVALANNETRVYFEKSTPITSYGVRKRYLHTNFSEIRAGNKNDAMIIPFVEGENMQRADRNKIIGRIKITGDKITRTIPVGSEVEITLEMDQSRLVRAKAFIPIIDEEIEEILELGKIQISKDDLVSKFANEKNRLEEVKNKSLKTDSKSAIEILNQIEIENMINEIENSIILYELEPDSSDRAASRLLDLANTIDKAEDALEWPWLLKHAEEAIEYARKIVYGKYGNIQDKEYFEKREEDVSQAILTKDIKILKNKINVIDELYLSVLVRDPGYWVWRLNYMKEHKSEMTDIQEAENLIVQGERAIYNSDLEALKSATDALARLLPCLMFRDNYLCTGIPFYF